MICVPIVDEEGDEEAMVAKDMECGPEVLK
jgi:hypothetical protein